MIWLVAEVVLPSLTVNLKPYEQWQVTIRIYVFKFARLRHFHWGEGYPRRVYQLESLLEGLGDDETADRFQNWIT